MGAARTWADSLPAGTPVADVLTRLRQRFNADKGSSDFCQGTSESSRAYIEAKFRMAQRMNLADDKFTINGIVQGLRADIRPKVMMAQPTSVKELIDVGAVAEQAVCQGPAATANLATADDVVSLKAAISAIAATDLRHRPPVRRTAAAERCRVRRTAVQRPWTRTPRPRPWPTCLLYTSPSPRDRQKSRMPSSA